MKKRIILIIIFIVALISLILYYTYAIDVSSNSTTGDADLTFDIDIKNPATRTVTVEAGKTKIFDINVSSSNDVNIKYGIAYSGTKPDTVRIAQLNSSKDPVSGNIASNTTKNITIVIENKSSTNYTYTLQVITGYQNGGNLIVPNNYTLITDIYTFPVKPNKPDLVQGLIPVKYDEANSTWVKADSINTNNDWYDYDNKLWANAVLVSSTNRSTYVNGNAGTVIPESDVLAYYVWIPRYKYKVWNINKETGTDSYDAYHTGIDILFEEGKQSTGTISCTYDFSVVADDTHSNETCTGSNGDYYTHPAFTFGNDELTGIWVGKFEMSDEVSKPNEYYVPSGHHWGFIYNMQSNNNVYGLNTSRSNTDSHMMKSLERGAVLYFTNSKYGRCNNNTCTEPEPNGYIDGIEPAEEEYGYKTGCGPISSGSVIRDDICNAYNTTLGKNASTTGNIYGIYDMRGGVDEYFMGTPSITIGSFTFYSDAISDYNTYVGYEKYTDTYAVTYRKTNNGELVFTNNSSRLGDARGETELSHSSDKFRLWYTGISSSFDSVELEQIVYDVYYATLFRTFASRDFSDLIGSSYTFITDHLESGYYHNTTSRATLVSLQ